VTISYSDARRGVVKLDVNADEVAELASKVNEAGPSWQTAEGRRLAPLRHVE
jgi:hypothetical protein